MVIYNETKVQTTAVVAIENCIFRDSFGKVWRGGGYPITAESDYGIVSLYVNFMLQALSDWANQDYIKFTRKARKLAVNTIPKWLHQDSPFNDEHGLDEIRLVVSAKLTNLQKSKSKKSKPKIAKLEKALLSLDHKDPFDFKTCCTVLGLEPEQTRQLFDEYKIMKQANGHSITIVCPTVGERIKGNQEGIDGPETEAGHTSQD